VPDSYTTSSTTSVVGAFSATSDGSVTHNGDSAGAFLVGLTDHTLNNGTDLLGSHIPTAGSPVVRAESRLDYDQASTTDSAIYEVEYTVTAHDSAISAHHISHHKTTASWTAGDVGLYTLNSNSKFYGRVRSPTTTVSIISTQTVASNTTYNRRLRYRINTPTQVQTVNGAVDGTGTPPTDSMPTLTSLFVGTALDGSVGDGTHIKRVSVTEE